MWYSRTSDRRKKHLLRRYRFLRESREDWLESLSAENRDDPEYVRMSDIRRDTIIQYIRRVILHDAALAQKASGKVSLNDLFLDPTFTVEDFERLDQTQAGLVMAEGLLWWKDATLEALAMWPEPGRASNPANLGNIGMLSH
jgi:hypothetical protein